MSPAEAEPAPPVPGAPCPRCRRAVPWTTNPHRPFCSLSCRLLDLGVWLDDGYRIEAEPLSSEGESGVP
jgi:uncharacterized protein